MQYRHQADDARDAELQPEVRDASAPQGLICGPLVLDVMRNRIALGIIPGEPYREPQAASFKQQALDKLAGMV